MKYQKMWFNVHAESGELYSAAGDTILTDGQFAGQPNRQSMYIKSLRDGRPIGNDAHLEEFWKFVAELESDLREFADRYTVTTLDTMQGITTYYVFAPEFYLRPYSIYPYLKRP